MSWTQCHHRRHTAALGQAFSSYFARLCQKEIVRALLCTEAQQDNTQHGRKEDAEQKRCKHTYLSERLPNLKCSEAIRSRQRRTLPVCRRDTCILASFSFARFSADGVPRTALSILFLRVDVLRFAVAEAGSDYYTQHFPCVSVKSDPPITFFDDRIF